MDWFLRNAGFEVECISETDYGISDIEVMRKAFHANLILVTEDKDFGELVHRLRYPHKGVLLIRLYDLPRIERLEIAFQCLVHYHHQIKDTFSVLTKTGLRILRR